MKLLCRKPLLIIASLMLSMNSFGATVAFDLSKTTGVLQPQLLAGTCLPIWNNQTIYKQIKKGLAQAHYRLFRFPNGSLSNGYHWNGKGANNSDSIWVCDSQAYLPGFMSTTFNRGTSVSNWGYSMASNITDGDSSTYWRSDELISGSMPYFYLQLSQAAAVDSIVIIWGEKYAPEFTIDFFTLSNCPYPGPFGYSDDDWENQKQVADNQQSFFSIGLSGNKTTKYVRVAIKKFREQTKSVEVKEVYLFSQGKQISQNNKKFTGGASDDQTMVIAMPTYIGSTVRPSTEYTKGSQAWHFEAFMDYIRSMNDTAVPLICVNYSTATPEEAAAWVHYANGVKNYNIRFWEIGNEMDGAWEDGGPITARMYAEKFLLFSKAMKKADSTIKIFGPLVSNTDFASKNSGLYDGRSWMQAFIEIVGQQEKTDGVNYCDGIDFHAYPYWAISPSAAGLIERVNYVYEQTDSLKTWTRASLANPDSTFIMMSEFNASSSLSDLLQKSLNGLFVANMYAGLADKFGSRAMSVFWDSFENGDVGPDGTFGSLSLFNKLDIWHWSSLTNAPSAAYWALFLAQNIWIDPAKENTIVPVLSNSNSSVKAYGIKTHNDFRALFFNFSAQPETLACSLSVNNYERADVFTWGEAQFKWIGSNSGAYAYPNCGPVSQSIAVSDLKAMILPGLSMRVIRYHASDTNAFIPQILHLWSYPTTGVSHVLPVCGSVFGKTESVTGINYTFDSAKTFSSSLRSLDSAFDGPFENFYDSVSLKGLPSGQHKMYVQAQTASGKVSIDSIAFSVSESGVKQSYFANNGSGLAISEIKTKNRIILQCNASLQAPVVVRVISSNGTCVKELPCNRTGGNLIEWTAGSGKTGNVAPGVYYLVVSSKGTIIYRTKMFVDK
jgi:hypothetical protein